MISSKLSPRRHNPRPPSICISKPPIIIIPPPPPLEWPPAYIIAEIHWEIPGYPVIQKTLTHEKTNATDQYQHYYAQDGPWTSYATINLQTPQLEGQSTEYYSYPYPYTQWLEFPVSPHQPFDTLVLQYPYEYPQNLTTHDHWKYP